MLDLSSLFTPATAFAGVCAYIGGIFTKPLTAAIENKIKRRQIRNSLYAELAGNYTTLAHMRNYVEGADLATYAVSHLAMQDIRFDAYDVAMKSPEIFYSLSEASSLRSLYGSIRTIVDPPPSDVRILKILVVTALEGLKMSVKFKHVDEQLLLKTAAESVGLVIHEKT